MGDGPTTGGDQATALATPTTPDATPLSGGGVLEVATQAAGARATVTEAARALQDPLGELVAGRYRIEAVLGTGGMAAVYRARDEVLGRHVALKIIAPVVDDPSAVRRERTEVELLASLNHHALVTLYDAGVHELHGSDRTYLVMELVEGTTLADRLVLGPVGEADVCRMAIDLAEALHVVHDHGVVHRDIKPGNVLLRPSHLPGREITAKLADFGIAYLIDSTRLTVAGGLIGTAAYLSPEQAQGHPPQPASDIYSLGLVLLEALTGVRSFPGTLMESISARLVSDPLVPDDLAPPWRTLLTHMTTRAPDDRPTALAVALAARAIELDHDVATTLSGSGAAIDVPTDGRRAADATSVLSVIPTGPAGPAAPPRAPAAAPGAPPSIAPSAGSRKSAGRGASSRSRGRRVLAVAAVLLVLAVAAFVLAKVTGGTDEPPTLPDVEEPLGTHLDDLLQSVTR